MSDSAQIQLEMINALKKATSELNEESQLQKDIQEKFIESFKVRISLTDKLKDKYKEFTKSIEESENLYKKNSKNIEEAFSVLNKKINENKDSLGKLNTFLLKTSMSFKKLGYQISNEFKDEIAWTKGILGGLFSIPKMAFNVFNKVNRSFTSLFQNPFILGTKLVLGGFISLFTQSMKYATRFVKFMSTLPLKIAGLAAKMGNSLRQDLVMTIGTAVEATKEMFDISEKYGSGAGSAIKSFAEASKSSLLEFRDITSESVILFGKGAQGVANRLQALAKRLSEMGVYADIFGKSLSKIVGGNASQFNFLEKSLRAIGASAEDVAYFSQEAVKSGQHINTVLLKMQMELNDVSKTSGVNQKIISRNFLVMRRNIQDFGHLSSKELLETSESLTKMGLSAQDAAGMFSKLDTFESAAQMAAMLSQSFGMNLDALKLIRAENPQEIFEDLRNAMMSTGRSFEQLNRHEKSLIASTTGLSQMALKSLFDFRDAGMSYEAAMKKMQENTPEAKQLKAFKEMSGSLQEIKNIMQETSFFESFFKGLRTSIVLASGIGDKFIEVSKTMEDFYLTAIGFGKDNKMMSSFKSAFKPIEDTLTKLIGDGTSSKKGLFNKNILTKTVKPFMDNLAKILGESFKDNSNLLKAQNNFSLLLKKTFDFNNIKNNPNNPGSTLFLTGTKLVGQFMKGFAAIGPGIVDTLASGFETLVDFIDGNTKFTNLSENFKTIFSLDDKEAEALELSIQKVLNTVTTKVIPSFFQLGKPIFKFIYDMTTTIVDIAFEAASKAIESTWLGSVLSSTVGIATNSLKKSTVRDYNIAKRFEFTDKDARAMNLEEKLRKGYDSEQAGAIGTLEAIIRNQVKDNEKKDELLKLLYDASESYVNEMLNSYDTKLNNLFNKLEENSIIIRQSSAKDWFGDLFGGQSVVQSGPSGMSVTNLADNDQILAGMGGGPVVEAIRYSGNVASMLARSIMQPSERKSSSTVQQNQQVSERPLVLNIDGQTIATIMVPYLPGAGLTKALKNPSLLKGQEGLNDNATRNPMGGSTEFAGI